MKCSKALLPTVTLVLLAASPPAQAGFDAKAILVVARALGFTKPPAPAGAKIAVVGAAAALADVQSILSDFSVSAGDGNDAYAALVSNAAEAKAAGRKVLTIGPLACVEAGACVMGIETTPRVTITLSAAAAAAAGIDFDPNFKLMVTIK
jgi:hypothetical protein